MKTVKFGMILSALLFMIVSVVGVAAIKLNRGNAVKVTSTHLSTAYDRTENQLLEGYIARFLKGDFSDLQGAWTNEEHEQDAYLIKVNQFYIQNKRFYLAIGGVDDLGLPYLSSFSDRQNRQAANLYYYPAGVAIPIYTIDGHVDKTGETDPSDKSRDRILFAQSRLTAEQVLENVRYREKS